MLHTLVVYVENKPGVLSRVASLFRRRAFNIDSLTVGRTEKPDLSRMTIVVDADEDQARRIVANIYKLVNVLLVDDITAEPAIVRDLALIKVGAKHEARSHVLELASVFRARVVDVAREGERVAGEKHRARQDQYAAAGSGGSPENHRGPPAAAGAAQLSSQPWPVRKRRTSPAATRWPEGDQWPSYVKYGFSRPS